MTALFKKAPIRETWTARGTFEDLCALADAEMGLDLTNDPANAAARWMVVVDSEEFLLVTLLDQDKEVIRAEAL